MDPAFIEDMADMVYDALLEPSLSVTEACVANNVGSIDLEPLDSVGVGLTGVGGVGADGELYQVNPSLQNKERINARVAMAGVLVTILLELLSGKPLTHFLGL
jgi:ferrochelatase